MEKEIWFIHSQYGKVRYNGEIPEKCHACGECHKELPRTHIDHFDNIILAKKYYQNMYDLYMHPEEELEHTSNILDIFRIKLNRRKPNNIVEMVDRITTFAETLVSQLNFLIQKDREETWDNFMEIYASVEQEYIYKTKIDKLVNTNNGKMARGLLIKSMINIMNEVKKLQDLVTTYYMHIKRYNALKKSQYFPIEITNHIYNFLEV